MTSGGWMTPHYGMIKENRGEGIILLLYIHILRSLFFYSNSMICIVLIILSVQRISVIGSRSEVLYDV